jgi:hypothetical protein
MDQLRSLLSTGITLLLQYYEPPRDPTRPGVALASCQLIPTTNHRWGFPCCVRPPFAFVPSPLPGRTDETDSILLPHPRQPSTIHINPSRSRFAIGRGGITIPRPILVCAPEHSRSGRSAETQCLDHINVIAEVHARVAVALIGLGTRSGGF